MFENIYLSSNVWFNIFRASTQMASHQRPTWASPLWRTATSWIGEQLSSHMGEPLWSTATPWMGEQSCITRSLSLALIASSHRHTWASSFEERPPPEGASSHASLHYRATLSLSLSLASRTGEHPSIIGQVTTCQNIPLKVRMYWGDHTGSPRVTRQAFIFLLLSYTAITDHT